MKIVHIKNKEKKDLYFPLGFPNEIKKDTFTYFIYGEGYKKIKKFDVLEEELPDRWEKLSWLDICYIVEKYGLIIGTEYADTKVAGIVARQTITGYFNLFKKCKHLLDKNNETDVEFFALLKCDYMLSCFGIYTFDVIDFDDRLAKLDPDYNAEECTYKDKKNVSISDYVEMKFGKKYVEIIDSLTTCEEKQNTPEE